MSFIKPHQYQIDNTYRQDRMIEAEQSRLAAVARGAIIPPDAALQLCQKVRQELAGQFYRPRAWVCKICASRGQNGIPVRLNTKTSESCRCATVNLRYRKAI